MKNKTKELMCLALGALISALALDLFLAPNKIASGGATGLGTVLYNSAGIPISATVLSVNAVLFVFGAKNLGKTKALQTLTITIMMSVFIQLFSVLKPVTDDMLLSAVFGGVLLGIGSGLTLVGGASTGGTDFLAMILNGIAKHIPVADFILIIDLLITLLSGVVFKDYRLLLYSLLALYINTRVIDKIIDGFRYAKLVYVVSNKSKEISKKILNELNMGVTALYGKGVYSQSEQIILLCAVRRNDFPKFRRVVEQTDNKAFIILTEANEVLGEGFNKK